MLFVCLGEGQIYNLSFVLWCLLAENHVTHLKNHNWCQYCSKEKGVRAVAVEAGERIEPCLLKQGTETKLWALLNKNRKWAIRFFTRNIAASMSRTLPVPFMQKTWCADELGEDSSCTVHTIRGIGPQGERETDDIAVQGPEILSTNRIGDKGNPWQSPIHPAKQAQHCAQNTDTTLTLVQIQHVAI